MHTNKNIIASIINATNGMVYFFSKEYNAKLEWVATVTVVIINIILDVNITEWMITIICISLIIALEMLNTAIEHLCNIIDIQYNLKIKIIKDISAGAVWLVSLASIAIAVCIYLPKLK